MMRALRTLCMLAALVSLAACGRGCDQRAQQRFSDGDPLASYTGGFDPARLDAGPLPEVKSPLGRPLVFVVPPFYAAEVNQGAAIALQSWLGERIGVPVEIQTPAAYAHESLALGLSNGTIDVAELSPYGFVLMEQRHLGVIPLVATVANGSSTYAAYFVVKRGAPIEKLADLKGKRVAFIDRFSTSGYLLPMYFLRNHGFDVERDFVLSFAGSHPEAVAQVRDGTVDAAAVSSDLLIGNSGLAGPLRVIAKAGRIPYDVIVVRKDLDPAIAARVRAALLTLSIHTEEGRTALKAFSAVDAFMPVPSGHYDEVRALARISEAQAP
jgi:phosphonate transport system substrate-binding protein